MTESTRLPEELIAQVLGYAERPEVPALWLVLNGVKGADDDQVWTKAYRRRFRQPPQGLHVMGQFLAMMRSIQDIRPEDATDLLRSTLDPYGIKHVPPDARGLVRTCIAAGANLQDPEILSYATCDETQETITSLVYQAVVESGVDITQITIPGYAECPDTCPGESLLHQATIPANNPAAVEFLSGRGADLHAFLKSGDCEGRPVAEELFKKPPFNWAEVRVWAAFQRAGVDLKPYLGDTPLHDHLRRPELAICLFPPQTPVDFALNKVEAEKVDRLNVGRFVIDLGIDLDLPDDEGDRLLHRAVKTWIRVEEGANESRRQGPLGNEAIEPMEQWRLKVWEWMEFIQLLIARGADPTLTDGDGKTARQLADESPLLPRCGIEEAFAPPAGRTIEAPENPQPLKRARTDTDAQE
jgi:hypothetical protein